ncbi:hypothetical protein BDY19DRAFT_948038 [Irpex rosettiformis]|uniref:Uncharacterized protein n=1 Tax=Irpex rosettiformis TaxID=378272 RepID=A0ACB8U3F8_9APHY|nr:hypothetical protein BDY19DRAFT_948038 [Irpex rosettiformis]
MANDSMTSFTLDNFPTELLLKIFSCICTDTGYAGCVLSLVSRRFHDVSSQIRFEKISLGDIGRMRTFLGMLKRMPCAPIVRHLFLCGDTEVHNDSEGPELVISPIAVCTSIISSLAPSLVTLAGDLHPIKFTYGSLFQSVASVPLLRYFSLRCHTSDDNSSVPPPDMPKFTLLPQV